jgi:hypothetical protein
MKSSKLISAVIFSFSLLAFLPAQEQLRRIVLDDVLVIDEIEGGVMYQKVGVTTDSEDNIYLTDLKGDSIKKFNKIGELMKKTGRNGKGPEEFNEPSLIKYFNDKLYVTESYRPGISVFDGDLKFNSKIPIRFTVTDLNFTSGNQIAVSTLVRDRSEEGDFNFCIYLYDSAGNEKGKIVYETSKIFTMMNMINFKIDRSNNLLIAYCWKDKIEKLDRNGNLLWVKSLLGNREVRTKKIKGTKATLSEYPQETVYKAIALDTYGNLFVLGGDLSENRNRDVYVLRSDGQHLLTFTLPESSHTIHIDSKNNLYSRSENGLIVRKYALKYIYE